MGQRQEAVVSIQCDPGYVRGPICGCTLSSAGRGSVYHVLRRHCAVLMLGRLIIMFIVLTRFGCALAADEDSNSHCTSVWAVLRPILLVLRMCSPGSTHAQS
jgi:hypothetical protein